MNEQERMEKDGLTQAPIKFYGKNCEHNYFSNFSPLGLWLPHPFNKDQTIWYPTGEHAFQARKAWKPDEHDYITESPTPFESKKRGRAIALREGWDGPRGNLKPLCYYVMLEVVWAKAIEHPHIMGNLLNTDERAIWEDSPTDDIWGIRYRNDYCGRNLLGCAWMEAREKLYAASQSFGAAISAVDDFGR